MKSLSQKIKLIFEAALSTVAITILTAAVSTGQTTTITYNEFLDAQSKAMERADKTPHRFESIAAIRTDRGSFFTTDSVVIEYESENRTHTYHDVHKGEKSTMAETVLIDSAYFRACRQRTLDTKRVQTFGWAPAREAWTN